MRSSVVRALFLALGALCVVLGVIGAVVPVLPTVPFLLLASACFVRSSDRAHRWLLARPVVGPAIRDYEAGLGIPLRAKRSAIAMLWASLALSGWLVGRGDVAAVLALIGAAVTIYLLRLPTRATGA